MYPAGFEWISDWWIWGASVIRGAGMASMTASVGERLETRERNSAVKSQIYDSISRLSGWLERNDYRGYDTFDGLNARFVRPLTFENKFLRTVLQQGVRRFPINLRPLLGVARSEEHTSELQSLRH